MTYLLTQIFFSLLAALLIGIVATWFYQRATAQRREEIIQQDYRSRLRQLELDRDRSVQNLSSEIEKLKKDRNSNGKSPQQGTATLADDQRVARLEERVLERESAITELRSEIQTLRENLATQQAQAIEKETAMLLQFEEEIDKLQATTSSQPDNDFEARITDIQRQHAAELKDLESSLSAAANSDFEEKLAEIQRQHTAELAEIKRHSSPEALERIFKEREQTLAEAQQADIARLTKELEATANRTESDYSQTIKNLQSEIQLRDDSIGVLRDDLAELRSNENIPSRGRQDDLLRSAMADALDWQEKYESLKAQVDNGANAAPAAGTAYDTTESKSLSTSRSGLDRIASAVSGVSQQRDNLQSIRGIGPVLEKTLNDYGVFRFQQIAEFESADIAKLDAQIGRFAGRIVRDDWIGQAMELQRKHDG